MATTIRFGRGFIQHRTSTVNERYDATGREQVTLDIDGERFEIDSIWDTEFKIDGQEVTEENFYYFLNRRGIDKAMFGKMIDAVHRKEDAIASDPMSDYCRGCY